MADFGSMSANDINASMGFGYGGVGDQSQALLNNQFGNFGQQTNYYSALGADYGRNTGYYGDTLGLSPGQTTPAAQADFWSGSRGSPAYDYTSLYSTGNQAQAPAYDYTSLYQQTPQGGGYDMSSGWGQSQAPAYDYTSLYQQPSWLSQYQVPAGPQPGEGSMSPALDAVRQYLAPQGGGYDLSTGWAPSTGGGIGSDAGQSPSQYQNQNPVVDWTQYFNNLSSRQQADAAMYPSSPGSGGQNLTPYGGIGAPANPNMQALLGYTPQPSGISGMHYDMRQGWVPDSQPQQQGSGGGGGYDLSTGWGTSSYPYSGNPYYMPQPMAAGSPLSVGGGLGDFGFGQSGWYAGQPGFGMGTGTVGQIGANVGGFGGAQQMGDFNPYGLPSYSGSDIMGAWGQQMPAFGGGGLQPSGIPGMHYDMSQGWMPDSQPQPGGYGGGIMAQGADAPAGSRDSIAQQIMSPANNYNTFQQASPQWAAAIPADRRDPDVINSVYQLAGQRGWSPAAIAALIGQETNANAQWDTTSATGRYRGLTQMQQETFNDPAFGGTIGGLTWDQYQNAPGSQQLNAYGDWLDRQGVTQRLNDAGMASQSPEMQAAMLQAAQFGPNATDWLTRLAAGDMSTPVTTSRQADELGNTSIGAMEEAYRNRMAAWPQ